MKPFLDNLNSLSWWLGVVVVGLLLNLVTPAVRKALLRIGALGTGRLRSWATGLETRDSEILTTLRADRHLQLMAAFDESRRMRLGVPLLLVGGVFLGFGVTQGGTPGIVQMGLGAALAYFGARELLIGLRLGSLIRRATTLPF